MRTSNDIGKYNVLFFKEGYLLLTCIRLRGLLEVLKNHVGGLEVLKNYVGGLFRVCANEITK